MLNTVCKLHSLWLLWWRAKNSTCKLPNVNKWVLNFHSEDRKISAWYLQLLCTDLVLVTGCEWCFLDCRAMTFSPGSSLTLNQVAVKLRCCADWLQLPQPFLYLSWYFQVNEDGWSSKSRQYDDNKHIKSNLALSLHHDLPYLSNIHRHPWGLFLSYKKRLPYPATLYSSNCCERLICVLGTVFLCGWRAKPKLNHCQHKT